MMPTPQTLTPQSGFALDAAAIQLALYRELSALPHVLARIRMQLTSHSSETYFYCACQTPHGLILAVEFIEGESLQQYFTRMDASTQSLRTPNLDLVNTMSKETAPRPVTVVSSANLDVLDLGFAFPENLVFPDDIGAETSGEAVSTVRRQGAWTGNRTAANEPSTSRITLIGSALFWIMAGSAERASASLAKTPNGAIRLRLVSAWKARTQVVNPRARHALADSPGVIPTDTQPSEAAWTERLMLPDLIADEFRAAAEPDTQPLRSAAQTAPEAATSGLPRKSGPAVPWSYSAEASRWMDSEPGYALFPGGEIIDGWELSETEPVAERAAQARGDRARRKLSRFAIAGASVIALVSALLSVAFFTPRGVSQSRTATSSPASSVEKGKEAPKREPHNTRKVRSGRL